MSSPLNNTPTRRRVDVYFVLYLVALVLLLPDWVPTDPTAAEPSLSTLRLELQPERVRLQHTVRRDSMGTIYQTYIDSINTIRYLGEVNDLQVVAKVRDDVTGQEISIQPGTDENSLFSVQQFPERHSIQFKWRPKLLAPINRTFRVTITGTGSPSGTSADKGGGAEQLPAGLRISGTTQFVLSTLVQNENPSDPTIIHIDTGSGSAPSTIVAPAFGSFWLAPRSERITQVATRDWTNRILVGSADPLRDLVGMPRVRVYGDIPGEVERTITADGHIELRGKTPRMGSVTIEVTAKRRDGDTARTAFVVQAINLAGVDVPGMMYPGVEYSIATNLPDAADAKALIKDQNVIRVETQGGILKFTPVLADTGKSLSFERTIGGVREGLGIPIRIRSFPSPEIVDVKDNGNGRTKRVIVYFYGDKERNRPMLTIVDGNAGNVKKLYGNMRPANTAERPVTKWIEEFEIERKDMSRPFSFKVQARDSRGYSSKTFVEE